MSELAGSLLQVLSPSAPTERNGALVMEFPVNPHLAPYLVSRGAVTSEPTLWLRRSHGGKVRAAPREMESLFHWFAEVVESVTVKGREEEWGNVHPLSKEGIQGAIAHVKSYGLEDLMLLAHPDTDWPGIDPKWVVKKGDLPLALLGLPLQPATWLPADVVVVIPKDRSYVGFVLLIDKRVVSVVHNASRGIGIARPAPAAE